MSSELSLYAVHRILYFIENDDRRDRKVKKTHAENHPQEVSEMWSYVYQHYFISKRPPPMEHLRSLKLALLFKDDVDIMRAVFKHGKPLVFDKDLPWLLVTDIVQTFQQLEEQPSFLVVTLGDSSKRSEIDLSEVWPQAYVEQFPCSACTRLGAPDKAKKQKRPTGKRRRVRPTKQELLAVETFHIPSKHFKEQLAVELYFTIDDPDYGPNLVKGELRKVTIRLASVSCSGSSSGTTRRSKSLLLLPEFALEVYGFLDRAQVGTSLLASRGLNELIFKLRNRLPVHHLECEFEQDVIENGCMSLSTGAYWMILRHLRRDLTYTDVRRFKINSTTEPAAECALIRRYLSNCHVADCEDPYEEPSYLKMEEPRFYLKMLAALVDRNFSLERLQMNVDGQQNLDGLPADGPLTDYRSLDAVFNGGMRLGTVELNLFEHMFASLVKSTDFFRMSTVQGLKALKLQLSMPSCKSDAPRRGATVSSSLWIAGIHLLRNAERFEVTYESDRNLRTIALKLVQLCEKFERGEIEDLVHHFKFATRCHVNFPGFPLKDDNKSASKVKAGNYKWDVYRFRNATTGEWLTACVGYDRSVPSRLNIVKGYVQPDASFVA